MAYIEVKHEYKRYQMGETEIIANKDLSFTAEKGQLTVILGPSGAGKSTVLNILGAWIPPAKALLSWMAPISLNFPNVS